MCVYKQIIIIIELKFNSRIEVEKLLSLLRALAAVQLVGKSLLSDFLYFVPGDIV